MGPSCSTFQGHSRSTEPTKINQLPKGTHSAEALNTLGVGKMCDFWLKLPFILQTVWNHYICYGTLLGSHRQPINDGPILSTSETNSNFGPKLQKKISHPVYLTCLHLCILSGCFVSSNTIQEKENEKSKFKTTLMTDETPYLHSTNEHQSYCQFDDIKTIDLRTHTR